GDYSDLDKDLAEEQERLEKHTPGGQSHDQQLHDPTRGRGAATAGKSGFVTGLKARGGAYVEVFQNPSKKELRAVDSWKEEGAVRAMLTESGDLIYWDARALHHEIRMELDSKEELVPMVVGNNYIYITDNVKNSFGGSSSVSSTDFDEKVKQAGDVVLRHKDKLKRLIGEFEIDHYGSAIEGNLIPQPYKVRKPEGYEKVVKVAEQVSKHTPGGQQHDQQRHDPTRGRAAIHVLRGDFPASISSMKRGGLVPTGMRTVTPVNPKMGDKPERNQRVTVEHNRLLERPDSSFAFDLDEWEQFEDDIGSELDEQIGAGADAFYAPEGVVFMGLGPKLQSKTLIDPLFLADALGFKAQEAEREGKDTSKYAEEWRRQVVRLSDYDPDKQYEQWDASNLLLEEDNEDYNGGLKELMITDVVPPRQLVFSQDIIQEYEDETGDPPTMRYIINEARKRIGKMKIRKDDKQGTRIAIAFIAPEEKVEKHTPGGKQHDQSTHGRRTGVDPKRPRTGFSNPVASEVAAKYVTRAGLAPIKSHTTVKVDKERGGQIAAAYESMTNDPRNPKVKAAYKAMADEVKAQYKMMPVKIEYTKDDPYPNSESMMRDVLDNKTLRVFTGGEKHPLLGAEGADGVTLNDNFRAVHDYFGHAMRGYQFGPSGEENAWMEHSKMFSPLAQRAMTTETRGQNSWFNFSKDNEGKAPKDRAFAEQKVGILPDEFLSERARTK
ncbi:hypothetical protein LCGC14_1675550, partial [marine sediment metagenome]